MVIGHRAKEFGVRGVFWLRRGLWARLCGRLQVQVPVVRMSSRDHELIRSLVLCRVGSADAVIGRPGTRLGKLVPVVFEAIYTAALAA